MRSILFWGLFPFILPQAIYVRNTLPRFSAARGPNEGIVGSGKNFYLLAIGDSIIAGVGATSLSKALVGQTAEKLSHTLKCRISWEALGSIGADSKKVIERLLPRLPDKKADFIVVSVGVNDAISLSSVLEWRRNFSELLDTLKFYSPQSIIAIAGIPPLKGFPVFPQPLRALFGIRGEIFAKVAREEISRYDNALYVSLDFDPKPEKFSTDGFHPSEESYGDFAGMLADRIVDKLQVIERENG